MTEDELDRFMARLPIYSREPSRERGKVGYRLRVSHLCTVSEELLIEYAKTDLGAKRVSADYLYTLRMILANQYDADKWHYQLELSQRTPIGSPRTMRTILAQMRDSGLTQAHNVLLGNGRRQVVYTYGKAPRRPISDDNPSAADLLEQSYRQHEGERPYPHRDDLGEVLNDSV